MEVKTVIMWHFHPAGYKDKTHDLYGLEEKRKRQANEVRKIASRHRHNMSPSSNSHLGTHPCAPVH